MKFPEFARSLDSRDGNLEKKKKHFLSDDEDDADSKTKTTLQEIKKYISHPKMSASKFFEEYGNTFQRLQVAAQFYLISPATSVPVERIFSHASFQVL